MRRAAYIPPAAREAQLQAVRRIVTAVYGIACALHPPIHSGGLVRHTRHLIALALLALSTGLQAHPGSKTFVRFEGAIGADPLTGSAGVDVLNVVRGVNPGGRAWVLRKLEAVIGKDGSINARGAGLLLASGDVIGTRAGITQVLATLACGPANNTATLFNSAAAALDSAGNFHLSGTLSQDGINPAVLPPTCDNPVLLIRAVGANGAPGAWFAAGIPDLGGDD
jgi:hypothetical protein